MSEVSDSQEFPREELLSHFGGYVAPGLRIVRSLGAGGQGRVVLAEDERLARSVAVKFLGDEETVSDPDIAARVRVEARTMAKVRHPAVVQVFDVGDADGRPYLVMEYIEGETIEARLRARGRPFDLAEALSLLEQIALGLQAVHEAGLAHGDLQPANVLISADHRARVVDFGLAFLSGGTAHYMAPELHSPTMPSRDVRSRQRADLYALGVVAYELLVGERPFDAPDRARVLAQHQHKAPPALLARRPDLPASLGAIVASCLAKEPADRPANAAAVAQELGDASRRQSRPSFRRVLLVDDDPAFRALVRAHVESAFEGVHVSEAAGGADAIAECERVRYDVVLLDLHMPDVNGVELAGALCAEPHAPRLLVLTGQGSARDWALLHGLGVSAFLAKPLEPDVLRAELQRALYD
ncbi:MAG: protein kinase [Deltaproteobacteria bacterium]|nr:protein kinase [Deltaproteobacteria bacterium]